LKVVHLIFEGQFEAEVIGLLHREVEVTSYLRLNDVGGAHAIEREGRSAYRVDDRNSMIVVVCEERTARQIMAGVEGLRNRAGRGIHAYVTPAEDFV